MLRPLAPPQIGVEGDAEACFDRAGVQSGIAEVI